MSDKLSEYIQELLNSDYPIETKRKKITFASSRPGLKALDLVDDRTDIEAANAEQPITGLPDNTLPDHPITHGIVDAGIRSVKGLSRGVGKGAAQYLLRLDQMDSALSPTRKDAGEDFGAIKRGLEANGPIESVGAMVPDMLASYAVPAGIVGKLVSKASGLLPKVAALAARNPKLASILGASADNAMQSGVISAAKGSNNAENDAWQSAAMGGLFKAAPVAVEKVGTSLTKHVLRNLSKSNGDETLVNNATEALLRTTPDKPGALGRLGNLITRDNKFNGRLRNVAELAEDESGQFTKAARNAHEVAYNSEPHITKTALRKAEISGTEGARMPASQLGDVDGYQLPQLGYSRVDLGKPALDLPEYSDSMRMIRDRLDKVREGTKLRTYTEEVPLLDPKTGQQKGVIPRDFKGFPNRLNGERLELTPEHLGLSRRVHNADLLEVRNEMVDAVRNSDIATQGKEHASTLAKAMLSRIQPTNQASLEKQLTSMLSKNPEIADAITKRDKGAARLEFMQEIMNTLKPVPGKEAIAASRVASGLGANAPVYTAAAAMSANMLRGARHLAQTGSSEGRFNSIMDSLRRTIPALNNN